MKTKYGKDINPDDFPYFGQFGDYVRKNIDREWGKDKEREITKKRKYEVFLSAAARRRYDCEDIVEKITDFTTEIEEMSDALDEMKNMCRDISERCKKLGDYGDD